LLASPEEPQVDLLRRLKFERIVPPEVGDLFHQLRIAGNRATHSHAENHTEALTTLKLSRQRAGSVQDLIDVGSGREREAAGHVGPVDTTDEPLRKDNRSSQVAGGPGLLLGARERRTSQAATRAASGRFQKRSIPTSVLGQRWGGRFAPRDVTLSTTRASLRHRPYRAGRERLRQK
jgi:hypothetical protein